MRIFLKILTVFLIIFCIFSVCCSAAFAISSSTIKINTEAAREKLFHTSSNYLNNSKQITLTSTMPYTPGEEGQYSKDVISCSIGETSVECQMISKLYNQDHSLIRTSYFPGDGFKYTDAKDEIGTKTQYANTNLLTYFSQLYKGVSGQLTFLASSNNDIETYKINFSGKAKLNLSKFTLEKSIKINYQIGSSPQKVNLYFDGKDHAKKVEIISNATSTIEIDYKKTSFSFPSFNDYVAI